MNPRVSLSILYLLLASNDFTEARRSSIRGASVKRQRILLDQQIQEQGEGASIVIDGILQKTSSSSTTTRKSNSLSSIKTSSSFTTKESLSSFDDASVDVDSSLPNPAPPLNSIVDEFQDRTNKSNKSNKSNSKKSNTNKSSNSKDSLTSLEDEELDRESAPGFITTTNNVTLLTNVTFSNDNGINCTDPQAMSFSEGCNGV